MFSIKFWLYQFFTDVVINLIAPIDYNKTIIFLLCYCLLSNVSFSVTPNSLKSDFSAFLYFTFTLIG